jgi:hypothetical protein
VDNAHYTEKCLGVDSASLNAATPTSRVHAVLGRLLSLGQLLAFRARSGPHLANLDLCGPNMLIFRNDSELARLARCRFNPLAHHEPEMRTNARLNSVSINNPHVGRREIRARNIERKPT